MCSLYENIDALCKRENICAAELARQIGQNNSMFTDLKTGRKKTLSIDVLTLIADYFDVSLDDLVGRKRKTPDEKSSEVIDRIIKLMDAMTAEQKDAFLRAAESLILPGSKE